mmetsp:Transcript_1562/g.2115  ORF Transcript_1562/g.2115 Transcript_1562/m.2115 type:complete len:224 (+) Transcript_1562:191-862(+)|eukprot:CAMPEP_0179451902 /NCGR_PEP_ID=MMETSP0799-20121207/35925_1 /TAXON_ID=46947 /ORGANISM="Geminigera cryophila, Strain CCMP2564" /LENGTH=223 /DNA_ID=CAMNT_0021247563 /DNA_START=203 /DNA_END=874 /DNA_ORIENTATION=+
MGNAVSNPCCGRERLDKDAPCMPLRRITALQDARVHFINDSPMMCILRDNLTDIKSGNFVIKDVNGITLFQVDGLQKGPRRLLLPGGTVHAMIERSSGEEWNCYVGDERRMTVVRRVVANNTVFLVHVLPEPFPMRGKQTNLPLPSLSVRGDFASKDFWMFDCSDLHGRKVAHASRGLPENSGLQPQKGMYVVEVAPGLDVALVLAVALIVDDSFGGAGGKQV